MENGPWTFRAYLRECTRQILPSIKQAQSIIGLIINVVAAALLFIAGYQLSIPGPYVFVVAISLAFLEAFLIFPYKVWRADKQEIANLKAVKDDATKRLWDLRKSGVEIRNRGLRVKTQEDAEKWTPIYETWHKDILEAAAAFSANLRHLIDPLDKLPMENVRFDNKRHRTNVSVMSEILVRVRDAIG
jgi:hypothetical protein